MLFGPHGFGSHGSTYSTTAEQKRELRTQIPDTILEIFFKSCVELTFGWRETACCEGIPDVISQTYTVGNVVDHLTLGIYATVSLRTRICTVQVYASQPRWTFCIGGALWPARNVWIPVVIGDTLACCCASPCVADSIAATWRWVAWIHWLWDPWWS